jgi:hypothetical protein
LVACFVEPTASQLSDLVLLRFDRPSYQLTALCAGLTVVALHCHYGAAPPSAAGCQADAQPFLPRGLLGRWWPRRVQLQRSERGWTLAYRDLPAATLGTLQDAAP